MPLSNQKDNEDQTYSSRTNSNSNGDDGKIVVNKKAVCNVCKRLYREPKILPCLHTFCADCIRQLEPFSVPSVNGKATESKYGPPTGPRREKAAVTVLCPECDSEVDMPLSGVDGLTTDHLALDEVFLETLANEDSLVCDLCSDGNSEKRCEVCCVNLCEFCSQAHRRQKRTASHTVLCLQELRTQGRLSRPVLCSHHPGQELRLFCDPCDLPVCLECAATFHRGHRCDPTHDVIERHGDRIRELVSASLRPRLIRIEESLKKVDISQEALQAHVDAAVVEVRAFAQGYASAVEAHSLSLLQRLEELRVRCRNQLHLQRAQLQQSLTDTRGSVEFAERLMIQGSETEILNAKGVTLRRLASLVQSGYNPQVANIATDDGSSICFLPNESAGEVEGYLVVGVIHAKTLDVSKCSIEGGGLLQGREGQKGEFTLFCRDSTGEQMSRGGEPVLVSIVHKQKKDCIIEATVVDNLNGSYSVSYKPVEPGLYSVWVCVKAKHVKGSPSVLNVTHKVRRHHGVFHCCTFCSSRGSKEARCGCPGTMPGGFQGCGHRHKGHPGKPHWSCCGNVMEKSECLPLNVVAAVSPQSHLRTVEL